MTMASFWKEESSSFFSLQVEASRPKATPGRGEEGRPALSEEQREFLERRRRLRRERRGGEGREERVEVAEGNAKVFDVPPLGIFEEGSAFRRPEGEEVLQDTFRVLQSA